jgi:aryl-alcohol dehydrogenase-like predicted oxidoreductase
LARRAGVPGGAARRLSTWSGVASAGWSGRASRPSGSWRRWRTSLSAAGHTLPELAFSWLLSHPPASPVIVGAMFAERVPANVAASRWRLPPDDLAEVDRLTPRAG